MVSVGLQIFIKNVIFILQKKFEFFRPNSVLLIQHTNRLEYKLCIGRHKTETTCVIYSDKY